MGQATQNAHSATITSESLRIAVEQISDRRVEWAIVEKLPPEDKPGAVGAESAPAK